jgi:hypothetical protein
MMVDSSVPENGETASPSRHLGRQISEKEGVRLMNPHIQTMQEDVLYHLALGSGSHDLEQMFGDVRFICMGGTPQRMKTFAEYMLGQLGYLLPTGTCLLDISERSHRYAMYKVGAILSIPRNGDPLRWHPPPRGYQVDVPRWSQKSYFL